MIRRLTHNPRRHQTSKSIAITSSTSPLTLLRHTRSTNNSDRTTSLLSLTTNSQLPMNSRHRHLRRYTQMLHLTLNPRPHSMQIRINNSLRTRTTHSLSRFSTTHNQFNPRLLSNTTSNINVSLLYINRRHRRLQRQRQLNNNRRNHLSSTSSLSQFRIKFTHRQQSNHRQLRISQNRQFNLRSISRLLTNRLRSHRRNSSSTRPTLPNQRRQLRKVRLTILRNLRRITRTITRQRHLPNSHIIPMRLNTRRRITRHRRRLTRISHQQSPSRIPIQSINIRKLNITVSTQRPIRILNYLPRTLMLLRATRRFNTQIFLTTLNHSQSQRRRPQLSLHRSHNRRRMLHHRLRLRLTRRLSMTRMLTNSLNSQSIRSIRILTASRMGRRVRQPLRNIRSSLRHIQQSMRILQRLRSQLPTRSHRQRLLLLQQLKRSHYQTKRNFNTRTVSASNVKTIHRRH